jgi:nicotinate-nucleotide adenylyltransferase
LVNEKATVAIFGGSFDPPHTGHQAIVTEALKALEIDTLLVVPTYLNPFKKHTLATPHQRLAWCQTLFDSYSKVEVSDFEVEQGEPTYTATTIRHFQQYYTVKYLIIGADNLESLHKWYAFEWLNQHVVWVIASRSDFIHNSTQLKNVIHLPVHKEVSSTMLRSLKNMESLQKYIDVRIETSVMQHLKEKNEPPKR